MSGTKIIKKALKIFKNKEKVEQKTSSEQVDSTLARYSEVTSLPPANRTKEKLDPTYQSFELAKLFLNDNFEFSEINFYDQKNVLDGFLDSGTCNIIRDLSTSALGDSVNESFNF